ncbi:MAG: hypothetical protein KJN95_02930, partial [Gammaproteobacteria bacterium]|nr:hypothetical protein [Gammaproteobacteria bacterium]
PRPGLGSSRPLILRNSQAVIDQEANYGGRVVGTTLNHSDPATMARADSKIETIISRKLPQRSNQGTFAALLKLWEWCPGMKRNYLFKVQI